ncbi:copper resistance protein CopK [Cupriavidus sp. SK-3]|nr:copper resistance protein CopK [Cupriavidus sp. SK-3]
MFKKVIVAVSAGLIAVSSFAADSSQVEKKFELKDGSTLYIFKDGKMSMENKAGHAVGMKEGVIMETKDGQKMMMKGNEVWRLEPQLHKGTLGQ